MPEGILEYPLLVHEQIAAFLYSAVAEEGNTGLPRNGHLKRQWIRSLTLLHKCRLLRKPSRGRT